MLFELLFTHAAHQPGRLVIVDDRGQYTYQELAVMSAGLGELIAAQTRQPRVGLLLPAGAGFVAGFYGGLLAGKVIVPINFLMGDREIVHMVSDSGIDTVLTIPSLSGRLAGIKINMIHLDVATLATEANERRL